MKNLFTISSKIMMLSVEVPVKVGDIQAVCEVMVMGTSDSVDIDYADLTSISYHNAEVSDIKKFIEFHKEMGIDLHKEFNKQIKSIITEEIAKELVTFK